MTSDELLVTDAGINTCAILELPVDFPLWGFSWWWNSNSSKICERWYWPSSLFMVVPLFFLISTASFTQRSLLYPSFKSVLLRADNLCLPPSDYMIVLNYMVRDGRLVYCTKWLLSACSGGNCVAYLIDFSLMFIEACTKFSPCLADVTKFKQGIL